jgi:anaerobic magnesium-protoporphyrin IX monomethyl ester cyclase
MPDTVSALDSVIRVPNLGLCSIAGNLRDCKVKVLDLAFHNRGITQLLRRTLDDLQPDVIGLSAMSFQYASACRVARICREKAPRAKIVLGGYHSTLMYEEIAAGPDAQLFDYLVRGEGELTFEALVEQLASNEAEFDGIPGLSFHNGGLFRHNPARPLADLSTINLPNRSARLIDRAAFMGQPFDCAETSRGCTMGCRFCSITHMYGRCIRKFELERVIADLKSLKQRGKQGVFFVDDNITLDVPRLKRLCELIQTEGLDDLSYVIQASVAGVDSDPELAEHLRSAGFKWVFLGIENGIDRNLRSMGKPGTLESTRRAVASLKDRGIGVFGGFIVAHPHDTAEDIRSTFRFALDLGVDHPIVQYLTPYPKTQIREDLMAAGLITNPDDYSLYNGFSANVCTESLTPKQLNNAVFVNGLRLYFNPVYLARSRFWRYNPAFWPALIANNVRYLAGARRGRIFSSKHRW